MDAAVKMETFQNLFYVSATLAVIGLGLAIFFYFFFDIRYIYMVRTGKDKQMSVEQMTKRSARNGRLRRMNKHPEKPAQRQPVQVQAAAVMPDEYQQTVPLNRTQPVQPAQPVEETSLLTDLEPTGPMRTYTAESAPSAGETQILAAPEIAEAPLPCNFVLTENTILIHTNEII